MSKKIKKKKVEIIRGGFWERYLRRKFRVKTKRKVLRKQLKFNDRLKGKKFIVIFPRNNFGIGINYTKNIMKYLGLTLYTFDDKVDKKERILIESVIESNLSSTIGGDLRIKMKKDIKHLKEIKSYRGIRHRLKLPVRGQRSKTNSRTVRKK